MVKLTLLTILSRARFIFYPYITFPCPLEYYECHSEIAIREKEVKERETNCFEFRRRLVAYQSALQEYHQSVDPMWKSRMDFAPRNKVQELRQQIKGSSTRLTV